jgi:hypothetical protein
MARVQEQYIHTVCTVIILLAIAVSLSTVKTIISISPAGICDFGCGLKLNTIVLPLLLISIVTIVSWAVWAKSKVGKKVVGVAVFSYIVLWGVIVAYARNNL